MVSWKMVELVEARGHSQACLIKSSIIELFSAKQELTNVLYVMEYLHIDFVQVPGHFIQYSKKRDNIWIWNISIL